MITAIDSSPNEWFYYVDYAAESEPEVKARGEFPIFAAAVDAVMQAVGERSCAALPPGIGAIGQEQLPGREDQQLRVRPLLCITTAGCTWMVSHVEVLP